MVHARREVGVLGDRAAAGRGDRALLARDVIAVGDHLAILHGLREGGSRHRTLRPRKGNIHTPIRQHRVGRIAGEGVVGGAWCV